MHYALCIMQPVTTGAVSAVRSTIGLLLFFILIYSYTYIIYIIYVNYGPVRPVHGARCTVHEAMLNGGVTVVINTLLAKSHKLATSILLNSKQYTS